MVVGMNRFSLCSSPEESRNGLETLVLGFLRKSKILSVRLGFPGKRSLSSAGQSL